MNPYEVLQIKPGASADEVKAAYHQLAKQWHPDKFSGAEKQEAEERFRSISEAYAAIKSGATQANAATQPPSQGNHGTSPKEKTPADWLADAKNALAGKQYATALSLSQYCFNYPQVAEGARLVYAMAIEETNGDTKARARAFEEVIRINPDNGEAIARLAELYLALNMPARAASMAAKAKAMGPANKGGAGPSDGIMGRVAGFLKR